MPRKTTTRRSTKPRRKASPPAPRYRAADPSFPHPALPVWGAILLTFVVYPPALLRKLLLPWDWLAAAYESERWGTWLWAHEDALFLLIDLVWGAVPLALVLGILWLPGRVTAAGLGLRSAHWRRDVLAGTGAFVLLRLLPFVGLYTLFYWHAVQAAPDVPWGAPVQNFSPLGPLGEATRRSWLTLAALVPLALLEELLFRGVLYSTLRARFNVGWALAVTAALFALAHDLPQTLTAVPVWLLAHAGWSVLACLLYEWRRSLWAPLTLHLLANLAVWINGG